jgi:flagellar M-ring protein FliF
MERRLRAQVEEIVAARRRRGRSRVQVAAELDANRVENRSETFDPDSRVVRSTQTRAENQSSSSGEGAVSVGRELPARTSLRRARRATARTRTRKSSTTRSRAPPAPR